MRIRRSATTTCVARKDSDTPHITIAFITYHIRTVYLINSSSVHQEIELRSPNNPFVHSYSNAQNQCKQQLVSLEQTATHVLVEQESEVVDDYFYSLDDILCKKRKVNKKIKTDF